MVSAHHDTLVRTALQMTPSNMASCTEWILNNTGIISSEGEEPLHDIQTAAQKFPFPALGTLRKC